MSYYKEDDNNKPIKSDKEKALDRLSIASMDEAKSFVKALDNDGNGQLAADELFRMSAEKNDLPSFEDITQGEAEIPFDFVITKMSNIQVRQRGLRKCLLYVIFLAVYIGILLCSPIYNQGEMASEINEWIQNKEWADGDEDGNTLDDIGTADDFWQWFYQVIIGELYDGDLEGTVLGFNNVIGGVILWQTRTAFNYTCSPIQSQSFVVCPEWTDPNGFVDDGVNLTLMELMPPASLYRSGNYYHMIYEYFPLYVEGNQSISIRNITEARTQVKALSDGNWINGATKGVIVSLILNNLNTKLQSLLQVKFAVLETGGIDYDIASWAGVVNPLSDDITQAHGMPWQFRITLEILFCLGVTVLLVKELMEMYVLIKDEIDAAKQRRRHLTFMTKLGLVFRGLSKYIVLFWNLVDLIMIGLCITLIGLSIHRYIIGVDLQDFVNNSYLGKFAQQYQIAELNAYVMNIANTSTLLELVNATVLMIAFFRLFKYFKFHPRLGLVTETLNFAFNDVAHFLVIVVMVGTGYAVAGHILFANRSYGFRSLSGSYGQIGQMVTLGIDYDSLRELFPSRDISWWATVPLTMFYYGLMLIVFLLLLNILMAIILDAYARVASANEENTDEFDDSLLDDVKHSLSWCCTSRYKGRKIAQVLPSMVDESGLVDPSRAEPIRPDAAVVLHEMKLIQNMILDGLSRRKGSDSVQVIPHQRIVSSEPGNLIVRFTFKHLSSAFSDSVAIYLWAKFGPGYIKLLEEKARKQPDTAVILAKETAALKIQLASMDHKLNILLEALRNSSDVGERNTILAHINPSSAQPTYNTTSVLMPSPVMAETTKPMQPIQPVQPTEPASPALYVAPVPVSQPRMLPENAVPQQPIVSDSDAMRQAFSDLMQRLLEEYDNEVPLQAVKNACISENIDWNIAKEMRRGMRIIQVKKTVDEQAVRIWQQVSQDKLDKISSYRHS